ncbi:MAG: hypothetical protein KF768_07245 [Phycisphaeraceae bacterium]|nr:hypothetical protein [Phycisphaeraceae bacterium]
MSKQSCETAASIARRLSTWSVMLMVLIASVRLMLVSHQEIATFSADDAAYTHIACGGFWGNAYSTYGYSRHPGYPLFMSLCTMLGLPLRIGIELVGLSAAWVCAIGLRRLGVGNALAVAAYSLVALHPHTITLFNRVLPDTLYAPGWLILSIGLAVGAGVTARGSAVRWGLIAGLGGIACATTRSESILVPVLIGLAGMLVAATSLVGRLCNRARPSGDGAGSNRTGTTSVRLLATVLIPLVVTLSATTTLKYINQREQGIFALADIDAQGFKRLYKVLLSISPEQPDPRFPVPADVRHKARLASPTYDRLLTSMESDPNAMHYQGACLRTTGVSGEWGSWTYWAMRQGAWYHGEGGLGRKWSNARELDDFYGQAADELKAAIRRGELDSRFTPVTFLPPDWGPLFRALPASSRSTWRAMTSNSYVRSAHESLSERQTRQFDASALRRTELTRLQTDPDFGPVIFWHSRHMVSMLDRVKTRMARAVAPATAGCVVVVFVGSVALVVINASLTPSRLRHHIAPEVIAASLILLAAASGRFLLIALLDASGIPALLRYTLPASLILPPLAAIVLHELVRTTSLALRRSEGETHRTTIDEPTPRFTSFRS